MKSLTILSAFVLLCTRFACAQQSEPAQIGYSDFVVDGNEVWLLTNTGQLKAVAVNSGKSLLYKLPDSGVIALARDRSGVITVATADQHIRQFNRHSQRWSVLASYPVEPTGLVFDSQNRCFALTGKGILDVDANKLYFPDSALYLNDQIRDHKTWFEMPTFLMDTRDRIWVGFGYGEWGGDVFVFDAVAKQFVKPQLNGYPINLNPVQAFVQTGREVFMATGMAHILTHGSIVAFDDLSAHVILDSKSHWTPISANRRTLDGGEYIGPATYNNRDKHVYIHSQHGIFRGNPADSLDSMSKWTLVIKPQLLWDGGQRNAVGPAMNVSKMQFTADGTLLFLTSLNGLGIYNANRIRFVK